MAEQARKERNSAVRGPAVMGKNGVIEGSFIDPYIGENVHVENKSTAQYRAKPK